MDTGAGAEGHSGTGTQMRTGGARGAKDVVFKVFKARKHQNRRPLLKIELRRRLQGKSLHRRGTGSKGRCFWNLQKARKLKNRAAQASAGADKRTGEARGAEDVVF